MAGMLPRNSGNVNDCVFYDTKRRAGLPLAPDVWCHGGNVTFFLSYAEANQAGDGADGDDDAADQVPADGLGGGRFGERIDREGGLLPVDIHLEGACSVGDGGEVDLFRAPGRHADASRLDQVAGDLQTDLMSPGGFA